MKYFSCSWDSSLMKKIQSHTCIRGVVVTISKFSNVKRKWPLGMIRWLGENSAIRSINIRALNAPNVLKEMSNSEILMYHFVILPSRPGLNMICFNDWSQFEPLLSELRNKIANSSMLSPKLGPFSWSFDCVFQILLKPWRWSRMGSSSSLLRSQGRCEYFYWHLQVDS